MIVVIFVVGVIALYLFTFLTSGSLIDFNLVWPLFIASFGLDHWFRNKNITKVGMTFIYLGIFLLLLNIGLYDNKAFKLFIPIYIIVFMLTYLLQNLTYSWKYGYVKTKKKRRKIYFTLFSSKEYHITEEGFDGLVAINILGGMDIDLSQVKPKDDIETVSIFSFCGESSITLPKRLNVVVIPSTLFGDTTIETKDKNDRYKKTIFVKPFSLLCSTDIQNKDINYE